MLKWFRERKKRRKLTKSSGKNRQEDDSEHIYAEIVDIPRLASVDGWVHDCSQTEESEENRSSDELVDGGPYMVVPLLASSKEKNDDECLTSFSCNSTLSRRHSAVSGSTGSVNVSYDSGTCQRSDTKSGGKTPIQRSKSQYSTGSSESSSIGDSCFEYDVKTSSDDEIISDYVISKMKENLQLKYSLQETVRIRKTTATTEKKTEADVEADVFSDFLDVAALFADPDADDGTLADLSDSDNSSGYYDSSLRKTQSVHSTLPRQCADCVSRSDDSVNLYDTPDMGTISLSASGVFDVCSVTSSLSKKLERTKIKTVCTPKILDLGVETKSAFRPVRSSFHNSELRSRTLSYKRNNSISSNTPGDVTTSREIQLSVSKLDCKNPMKQRSKSMDNLHVLSSATSRRNSRASTPGCRRKFSQLSLAPSSCDFQTVDKDVPDVTDVFVDSPADEKTHSEVYSLPNFVPITTMKKKPEVARSRDGCSADIYRSPGRNNRLLSDLIMNNYSQRQFVVR